MLITIFAIKWPKSIDLATSYSYNSGGHKIYFKTSSNSSKLLQTPSKFFQNLSTLVQTLFKCVQTRPNVSKLFSKWENFHFSYFFIFFKLTKKNFSIFLKNWLLLSLNASPLLKHFTFPHLYSESFPLIGHFCP